MLCRVVNGVCTIKKASVDNNKKVYTRLWVHEVFRVFYDRLIDAQDTEWLFGSVKHFGSIRFCPLPVFLRPQLQIICCYITLYYFEK